MSGQMSDRDHARRDVAAPNGALCCAKTAVMPCLAKSLPTLPHHVISHA